MTTLDPSQLSYLMYGNLSAATAGQANATTSNGQAGTQTGTAADASAAVQSASGEDSPASAAEAKLHRRQKLEQAVGQDPQDTLDATALPVSTQAALVTQAAIPELPHAAVAAASPEASNASLAGVSNISYGLPTGAMAFGIIWAAMLKMQKLAGQTKVAVQQVANASAVLGATASIKEALAKRSEATVKFMGGLGGAALGMGLSFKGASMGVESPAKGQLYTAAGSQAANVFSSGVEALNQNVGYGYDASQAQIQKSQADLRKTFFQQMSDGQDANKKQVDQNIEQTLTLLQQYNQRYQDVMRAIAS